jgi:hypothetical protein
MARSKPARALLALTLLATVCALVSVATAGRQKVSADSRRTYSPKGALFSMRVPGAPLPAQGHIFDPEDNDSAHGLLYRGLRAKTYNFEIHRGGERRFLVSILEVWFLPHVGPRAITESEVEAITNVIGDDIRHSPVSRQATNDGELSHWSYKRKGGVDDDDVDDGVVYVLRRADYGVVVVVDYDYAKPGDPDVKMMLDSLELRGRAGR